MEHLIIHCTSCRTAWQVYPRDMTDEKSRCCPGCYAEIDAQTWRKQILPAFGAMMDANKELQKDSTGYDAPPFQIDYIKGN